MAQTVNECLTAGLDSVSLINSIKEGTWNVEGMTQTEINEKVQKNVDHLEIILLYKPVDSYDDTPNIVDSTNSKKDTCKTAITTGKAYILENS
mgnify:CR=1 FL=1|tara:strand:- start:51 stop:329 length:279 start_codon:yes stop_codon:yes gene_type:complete